MSKKLLSEAQVRRFQSLASIKPLNEMYNEEKEEPMEEELVHEEEEVDEGYAMKRDEEPMAEEMDDDGDVDVDMGADGEDDDDVEIEEEMVEKAQMAMKDLQALVDALGGEGAAMGDEAEDAPEMPAMDDAPDMGDDAGKEDEEEAMLELALEGIEYQPSQKEIVKEVAKRVARRLVEAKQAQTKLNKALGKK